MTDTLFNHHRQAALALLNNCATFSHKEAGFLGHICIAQSMSDRQRNWLSKLLERHGFPHLSEGGAK